MIKTYYEYSPSKLKIYFTKNEIKELKTFGNPSLILMGFKPLYTLKPYYNYKPSYFMYPNEKRINGSTIAFNSLIKAMISLKKYCVARFIYRKTSIPRFVALIAQDSKYNKNNEQIQYPGMAVIFLPYKH